MPPAVSFGTEVTVFGRSGRILPKEDKDIAGIVQDRLAEDGVTFKLDVKTYTSVKHEDGTVKLSCEMASGETHTFAFDALLVAAGRRPNVGCDRGRRAVAAQGRGGRRLCHSRQTPVTRPSPLP